MSDFAEGLFGEELTPVPLEQVVFDYRLLSVDKREFVLQKTDETQILLKRTAEKVIQIGCNLLEVKNALPHGMFLPWLQSEFSMSQQTANNFMNVAERFGTKLLTVSNLSASVLYMLASPSTPQEAINETFQRAETGEKITKTLAKQIIDAQDAIKKAQEAEAAAYAEAQITQQRLLKTETDATSKIDELNNQIEALQQEMKTLTTPPVEIRETTKEVTPEATTKQLKSLQEQIKALTEERNAQKERIQTLSEEMQEHIRAGDVAENNDRIRQEWRHITSEAHSCMMRLLGQWPTPLDVQAFDADDWARVDHLRETLSRVIEECNNLRYRGDDMIIEANGSPHAFSLMENH